MAQIERYSAKLVDLEQSVTRVQREARIVDDASKELVATTNLLQSAKLMRDLVDQKTQEYSDRLSSVQRAANLVISDARLLQDRTDLVRSKSSEQALFRKLDDLEKRVVQLRSTAEEVSGHEKVELQMLISIKVPEIHAQLSSMAKKWKHVQKVSDELREIERNVADARAYVLDVQADVKPDVAQELLLRVDSIDLITRQAHVTLDQAVDNSKSARSRWRMAQALLKEASDFYDRKMTQIREQTADILQTAEGMISMMRSNSLRIVNDKDLDDERRVNYQIKITDQPTTVIFPLDEAIGWLMSRTHSWTADDIGSAYREPVLLNSSDGTQCAQQHLDVRKKTAGRAGHRDTEERDTVEKRDTVEERSSLVSGGIKLLAPGTVFAWHYFLPQKLRLHPDLAPGGGIVVQRTGDLGIGSLTLVASVHARALRNIIVFVPDRKHAKFVQDSIGVHYLDVNVQQLRPEKDIDSTKFYKNIGAELKIRTYTQVDDVEINSNTSVFMLNPRLDMLNLAEWFLRLRKTREVFFFTQVLMRASPSELMFMAGVLDDSDDNFWTSRPTLHDWNSFQADPDAVMHETVSESVLLNIDRILQTRISWYDPFLTSRINLLESVQLLAARQAPPTGYKQLSVVQQSHMQLENALFDQGLAPYCADEPHLLLYARADKAPRDELLELIVTLLTNHVRNLAIDRDVY